MDSKKNTNVGKSNIKKKKNAKNEPNDVLSTLKSMAEVIAKHIGNNCEVCIHDLKSKDVQHSIVYIINNHVTGRKIGDSFSFNYLKSRKLIEEGKEPVNKIFFHNQTLDGKYLKCSTFYAKDSDGKYRYMICINQDISRFLEITNIIDSITKHEESIEKEEKVQINVRNILDDIINNSIKYIGKAPANMTPLDKQKAIEYLNDAGAFLVAKSGDKIAKTFGISKFTIYSYIHKNST